MNRNCYLKFDVVVRDHFKSTNTAILFSRMLYWFERQPGGFWKFKQPCTRHKAYKKGDSWGEELGMARKVLDPLMNRLCTRYQAKIDFLSQADKFKGKMFASYLNRKTNQTHYVMNSAAVKDFFTSLGLPIPKFLNNFHNIYYAVSTHKEPSAVSAPSTEGVDKLASHEKNLPFDRLRDVPIAPPLARARLNTTNTQTTTTLGVGVQTGEGVVCERGEEEVKLSQQMVREFNSQTASNVIWLPSHVNRLIKTLNTYFGGKIEAWIQFLREKVSTSKFLMGEAKNSKFKAILWWIIKPDVLYAIFQGGYGVGTRIVNQLCNAVKKEEVHVESLDHELLNVNFLIKKERKEIIDAQKKTVSEHEELLSQKEKDKMLDDLKKEIYEKNKDYNEFSKTILFNAASHNYVKKHFCKKLGFNPEIFDPFAEDRQTIEIAISQELLDRKNALIERRIEFFRKQTVLLEEKKENNEIIQRSFDENFEEDYHLA